MVDRTLICLMILFTLIGIVGQLLSSPLIKVLVPRPLRRKPAPEQ